MTDWIVLAILVVVIGGAIAAIVRAKKKGVTCIGCSHGGSCPHKCSGGCHCHNESQES